MEVLSLIYNIGKTIPIEIWLAFLALFVLITLLSFLFEKKEKPMEKQKDLKNKNSIEDNIKNSIEDETPTISNFEIQDYHYNNVKLDTEHSIDTLYFSKKGIFLIFNMDELKGEIKGELDNEFIYIGKKKIINPFIQKSCYVNKLNNILKEDINFFEIIFISKKIKNHEDSNMFSNFDNFLINIKNKNDAYNDEKLTEIADKLYYLEKRRK